MKILLVDDNSFSKKFIQDFISSIGGVVDYYCCPQNYESALVNLADNFDLALFDFDLCDKKTGYDLYCEYMRLNPTKYAYLYSANSYIVNRTPGIKTVCLSDTDLQDVIRYHFTHNITAKDSTMTPPANAMAMSVGNYNEKVCENLHKQNEKEHEAIKDSVSEVRSSMKEVSKEIRDAIKETREDNRKIFFVTIGVFATLVANLALSLLKG